MAVRKVTRERVSLHLPSEGMAREAHGMRHIWVGVMEGASRDHQNIPQSLPKYSPEPVECEGPS